MSCSFSYFLYCASIIASHFIDCICRSIDDFKGEMIADDEFQNRALEIELVIAEAQKAIVSIR